jgi:hypothetical protein
VNAADVVSIGISWAPFIGYVGFRSFLAPWRRLYFVLDSNSILGRLDRNYASAHSRGEPAGAGESPVDADVCGSRRGYLRLFAAGAGGAALSVLRTLLSPSSPQSVFEGNPVHVFSLSSPGLERVIGVPGVMPVLLFVFMGLAMLFRRWPKAWSLAFVAGLLIPYVLFSK